MKTLTKDSYILLLESNIRNYEIGLEKEIKNLEDYRQSQLAVLALRKKELDEKENSIRDGDIRS